LGTVARATYRQFLSQALLLPIFARALQRNCRATPSVDVVATLRSINVAVGGLKGASSYIES